MKPRDFSTRITIVCVLLIVWAVAIGGRLYMLQVIQADELGKKANRQQQRSIEVSPRRGVIMDRNGQELAISIKVDSVFAVPKDVKEPARAARILARYAGLTPIELEERLRSEKSFVWIKRKVSQSEADDIRAAAIAGIYFQQEDRRFYPKKQLAAHALGYVGIDEEGMGGLEFEYNSSVRGEPGRVVFMSDARGRSFQTVEQPPAPGANLITTLDENIQYIVERELAATAEQTKAKTISIIVMDPRNGEILAMASHPSFNPNEYTRVNPDVWTNKAVHMTYEPGSTFKIVTAASAFEENLTTPDEVIDCQMGSIVLFGHRIRDHKPFGALTVKQIMQYSSDVGVIKLGLRLGDGRFASYIERMGFGRPTHIDLPGEEIGLTKPASRWSRISVGAISMGQEIGVTPLQILRLVSAVANGGILYRPHLMQRIEHPQRGILEEAEPQGQRVMSPATAEKLRDMLEVVVTDGTAKTGKLEGYRGAGKTGTAQKIDPVTRAYSKTKHVASFAGFAPASNPLISVIVVIDEPVGLYHGGDVAAPVFKRITEQALRSMSVPSDIPEYAPRYAGEKGSVLPAAATKSESAQVVDVRLDPAPVVEDDPYAPHVTIPDLRGQTLRQATAACLKLGLQLRSIGSGRGVEQQPEPGASVVRGSRIVVRFTARS